MKTYVEIKSSDVPNGVRFDVPLRNRGQIVEVAYGGFARSEHDEGDPYKRVTDRSQSPGNQVKFYRLYTVRVHTTP